MVRVPYIKDVVMLRESFDSAFAGAVHGDSPAGYGSNQLVITESYLYYILACGKRKIFCSPLGHLGMVRFPSLGGFSSSFVCGAGCWEVAGAPVPSAACFTSQHSTFPVGGDV